MSFASLLRRPAPPPSCYRCEWEWGDTAPAGYCLGCGAAVPVLHGAHQTAGVTTLARACGFHDEKHPGLPGSSVAVPRLLVARFHAGGLEHARTALRASPGRFDLLVLVADYRGGVPKALRDQTHVLSGIVPLSYTPWVPVWRHTPDAEPPEAFGTTRHLLNVELRRTLGDNYITTPHDHDHDHEEREDTAA